MPGIGKLGLATSAEMREAIHEVVAFPLYAVGWLAGLVVRALVWCRDAIIAGYIDGRAA